MENLQIRYRVEKFVPTHCPNCGHHFTANVEGGFTLKLWPQQESLAATHLQTDVIICGKCANHTLRVVLEVRDYLLAGDAREAICREGFRNLLIVTAYGNMVTPDRIRSRETLII